MRRSAVSVPLETRKELLGQKGGDIATRYSVPEIKKQNHPVDRPAEDMPENARISQGTDHDSCVVIVVCTLYSIVICLLYDCCPERGSSM